MSSAIRVNSDTWHFRKFTLVYSSKCGNAHNTQVLNALLNLHFHRFLIYSFFLVVWNKHLVFFISWCSVNLTMWYKDCSSTVMGGCTVPSVLCFWRSLAGPHGICAHKTSDFHRTGTFVFDKVLPHVCLLKGFQLPIIHLCRNWNCERESEKTRERHSVWFSFSHHTWKGSMV